MDKLFQYSKYLLYILPLGIIIVSTSTLFPFIVGKYVWFRGLIDIILILFLTGILLSDNNFYKEKIKKVLKSPLTIVVLAFTVIFLLAGFFGVDPKMSFWSNFERGEGGIQILHLTLFFLLLGILFDEEKDWRRIFIFSLIGGVIMALYGFLAASGAQGFIGPQYGEGFRLSGSIGNPAYTAAYSIFMMFYAAYLIVSRYRQKLLSVGSLMLFGLIIFFSATFLLAATRGAFMGLIAAAIVFLGYFAFSKKEIRKWGIIAVAVILIAVSSMIYFKDTAFVKSIPGSRIFDISFSTQTFQHRTFMWQMAWDGFKERPLLGWGPENYIQIFDRNFNINYFEPDKGFGAWFDRAHSIYFDYLAETGILGLLSYLAIFGVFCWQFIKFGKQLTTNDPQQKQNNYKQKSLVVGQSLVSNALILAMPVAYLVQGIVLFEVFPLYFNLFLFLAFVNYKFNFEKNK